MNSKEFLTRIQMKRDTSSNWVVSNPVLLDGEVVIVDTDAGAVRYKVGDGTKKFTQLPFTDENMLNLVNNKQDKLTIDTLPTSGSSNPVASGGVKDYAVPQTRTVNGKPLSSNVTLVASDIDADASGSAAQALMDAKSYTDAKVGTVESTVAALSSNVASTYETQTDAAEKLQKAKDYADSVASGKADTNHHHDDRYYTETETNALLVSLETKSDASDKLAEAKSYADAAVSGLITATAVDQKMAAHNTATGTHNDIRALISDLNTKVTHFLDVDEETTDQLSEVLEMIEANEGTIESLTTSKVSVSDIANNLTTNSAGRVLSAAQGVYIQSLINGVDNELETHATDTSNPHGVTKAQVGLSNVDNTADASKPVSAAQAIAIADAKSAGTQAQTNLTAHINTKTNPHAVTAAQAGALALAGGKMTGEIAIGQNDGFGIQVGTNGRINATDSTGSTTCTILGVNGANALLGHGSFNATLRGKGTRPTYNGANLALYSDIASVGDAAYVNVSGDTMAGNLTMGANAVAFGSCSVKYDSTNECLNFAFA